MSVEQSIEDIVRSDPHVKSVTYASLPQLLDVDTEIDYGLFPSLSKEDVTTKIEIIYKYLHGPVIQDDFESHPQRKVWVNKMYEIYGQKFLDYVHTNKVRANAMTPMNLGICDLGEKYEGERADDVKRLVSSIERLSTYISEEHTPLEHKLNILPLFDQTIAMFVFLLKKEG